MGRTTGLPTAKFAPNAGKPAMGHTTGLPTAKFAQNAGKPAMGRTTGLPTAKFAPNAEKPATVRMIGMAANVPNAAKPVIKAILSLVIVKSVKNAVKQLTLWGA